MNINDFTLGYEIDDTGLVTEEARRAFKDAVNHITLNAKIALADELREIKRNEKQVICRERAEAVKRSFDAYMDAGLTEEQAWELVKQEAMTTPYRLGGSA